MSFEPLRDELNNILNIIADLSENNIDTDVMDNAIIARANLPRDEVHKYLNELRSLDLIIEQGSRPTDVDFRLYRITKEALEILDDKDLR